MAKTIKEDAYNSLLKENVRSTESDYSRGYLKGYGISAIDMLEKIEDIVYRRYSSDSNGTERNRDLINRIRQLRGK